MGMSYEQYWDGPCHLAAVYREAFRLRRQIDNEQAWLQGLYIYDAIAICVSNAMGKKGSKKQNYLERPIDIFPLTEQEKKIREAEEQAKMQKAMEEMIRKQRLRKQKGD